jgi:hypothetical protein
LNGAEGLSDRRGSGVSSFRIGAADRQERSVVVRKGCKIDCAIAAATGVKYVNDNCFCFSCRQPCAR